MRFRFGRFELDEEAGELRRDGVPVALQPKPFELLCLLVRERARVVPADEIFDALWPGVAVTPSSLTRAVSLARRAIDDTHKGEILRSVARRGYRFVGDGMAIEDARRSAPGPVVSGSRAPAPAPSRDADPAAAAAAAAVPGAEPFVGRSEALEQLRAVWREAIAGQGALALVGGPPGIGKTRLAELFADEVARAGATVLTGRSREGEGVPALWLWAQVLRRLVERGPVPEDLEALRGAPAELAELVPELGSGAAAARGDLSPEQSRFLLFDAVTRTLVRASRRRPLLVFLEDLQWAGSTSLRLLEHLSYEIAAEPLLLVATVREETRPREHPLERVLPALRQQPRCVDLPLRGFSRREVADLLARTIGRPPPADLTSELFARTEGVPLFLREAIRLLAERGDLDRPERVRRWAVTLPPHALDLIRRPLERLSPPGAELMGAAAVLGREFTLSLAAAVAGTPRESALDHLDEAERAGVVEPVAEAPGTWRFAHALFQEAAYEALPAGRRARLHARAAAELERRHAGDLDRVVAELAHHHHEAIAVGDPERAFAFARQAAERATRMLAHEQAAAHHAQAVAALDQCEPVDPARRLEALLALGEAHRLAGERERRRAVFAEAMDAARALGRPLDAARAAIGFCDLSEWAPRDDEAYVRVAAALAAVPEDAVVERTGLLTRLAYLSMRGRPDEAEPLAREAVAQARRSADPRALQEALYGLFFRLAGPDHIEERTGIGEEIHATVDGSYLTDASLIAFLDMACDGVLLGDREALERWRAVAVEGIGEPLPSRLWHLRVFDVGLAIFEGRFAEAERWLVEAERLGRRIGHPYARGVDRSLRVWLARERGAHEEVLRLFEPRRPMRLGPVQWVTGITARSLVALGRLDEARGHFEDLVGAGVEAIPRNIRWHDTIAEAALLCAELGDGDRARALLDLLEPVAHHHGVLPPPIYYAGPFTRCLARLRETLGDLGLADELYAEALEGVVALGAQPMRARLLAERGALLARRGDRRHAREALGESFQLAGKLGMAGVADQARAALERL